MAENQAILNGEEPPKDSVNRVNDVPQAFTDWLKQNEERAKRSTSTPYFISDNKKYLPTGYKNRYALKMPYETNAEYVAAMKYNKKYADFTPEVLKNIKELNQALPVMQGKIMNFTEANEGKCNPMYGIENYKKLGYAHNCQTCTMTYELRRRGFNVEAMPNPIAKSYIEERDFDQFCSKKGVNWLQRYLNADRTVATYTWSGNSIDSTTLAKATFIDNHTQLTGRYEVYCAWKGRSAHVFIAERTNTGELLYYDPQTGQKGSVIDFYNSYIKRMKHNKIGVLRIDDKLINPKFAQRFLKARK